MQPRSENIRAEPGENFTTCRENAIEAMWILVPFSIFFHCWNKTLIILATRQLVATILNFENQLRFD